MNFPAWRRVSPATRVAVGLVSLMVSLILIADLFIGFLPDRPAEARHRHAVAAALVSSRVTATLRDAGEADAAALETALATAMHHEPQLRSIAIVAEAGKTLARLGDPTGWTLGPAARSTIDNVRTPIAIDGRPWGELQLVFRPALPTSLVGWLGDPLVKGLALASLLGFIGFQLYLRRVLRYLDPSAAVPERVRTAFDTLTEGVLVLDDKGLILLANRALRSLEPAAESRRDDEDRWTGQPIDSFTWLSAGLAEGMSPPGRPEGEFRSAQHEGTPVAVLPWRETLADNQVHLGYRISLGIPGAGRRELVMNCSPISDGSRQARGCLMTFSDVTELEDRSRHLRETLEQLGASQAEIELKNEELTRLATRDALTGCLNRRSFMAETDQRFAEAQANGTPACVIMCDIDHFKQVNDKYGHAGGDRVIQAAVKALSRGLRVGDLLGRYGGEEFCLMLPGATMAQTLEIAERLRADVEANVGDAIREPAGVKVTMSFGVAELNPATPDPAYLIDLADQALYLSKKNGRNRVTAESALKEIRPEAVTV